MAVESDEFEIEEEEERAATLSEQALWVLIHLVLATGSWAAMMALITLAKPSYIPVLVTLGLSFTVPLLVGNLITRWKRNDMASYMWLVGMIWFLIVCLWILDMPTGPNQCYHCDASQKLWLTFFSPSEDSGLIDNEGRMIGTWPAAALFGYGIGARLALKKRR